MTLWCMFRSPLMIGAELTMMDEWTMSLLTNKDVLGLLKESCQGTQIIRSEVQAVWKNRDNETGVVCIALFNLSDTDGTISVDISELGEEYAANEELSLVELWDGGQEVSKDGTVCSKVPAHGAKLFKILDMQKTEK